MRLWVAIWCLSACLAAVSGKPRPGTAELVQKITDGLVKQLEVLACQDSLCRRQPLPQPPCYNVTDPNDPDYVTPPDDQVVQDLRPTPGVTDDPHAILSEIHSLSLPLCEPEERPEIPGVPRTAQPGNTSLAAEVKMCPCSCASDINVVFRMPRNGTNLRRQVENAPAEKSLQPPALIERPPVMAGEKNLLAPAPIGMPLNAPYENGLGPQTQMPPTVAAEKDLPPPALIERPLDASAEKSLQPRIQIEMPPNCTKPDPRAAKEPESAYPSGPARVKIILDPETPLPEPVPKPAPEEDEEGEEEPQEPEPREEAEPEPREEPEEEEPEPRQESEEEERGGVILSVFGDQPVDEAPAPPQKEDHEWRAATHRDTGLTISWRGLTESEKTDRQRVTLEGRQATGTGEYQVIVNGGRKNMARYLSQSRMNGLARLMNDAKAWKVVPNEIPGKPPLHLNMESGFMINSEQVIDPFRFRYEDQSGNMVVYGGEDRYIWAADTIEEFGRIVDQEKFLIEIPADNKQTHANPLVITRSSRGIVLEGGPKIGLNCQATNELTNVNLVVKSRIIKAKYAGDAQNRFAEIPLSENSVGLVIELSSAGHLGIKVHQGSDRDEWTSLFRRNAFPTGRGADRDLRLAFRRRSREEMELQFSGDGRKGSGGSHPYEVVMNDNPDQCVYVSKRRLGIIKREFLRSVPFPNVIPSRPPAFVSIRPQLIFTGKLMGDLSLFPIEFSGSTTTSFHPFNGEKYMYKPRVVDYQVFRELISSVWGYRLVVNDRAFQLHPLVMSRGYSKSEREYECGPKVNVHGRLTNRVADLRLDTVSSKLTCTYKEDPGRRVAFMLQPETVSLLQYLRRHKLMDVVLS